jgi:transposase-like protein
MTIGQWEKAFPDEDACKTYLKACRWPDGVHCPRCGSTKVYDLKTMRWKWECPDCREGGAYRFSIIAGTIFENTKYPLRAWFRVIHMILTSKKGVAALEVHRVLGTGSYETAWSMCMRIRAGLANEEFRKLMGIVEVDETFIGGKAKNKHWDKRDGKGGGTGSGKSIVAGAVTRKGNVVARVIADVTTDTLTRFVRESVATDVSLLCTDQYTAYRDLGAEFPHGSVDHAKGQYVVGAIHTNTIEGFWSLIKRGVVGTYHKVSRKYLPLYVAEFQFRYNNRLNADIFGTAMRGC